MNKVLKKLLSIGILMVLFLFTAQSGISIAKSSSLESKINYIFYEDFSDSDLVNNPNWFGYNSYYSILNGELHSDGAIIDGSGRYLNLYKSDFSWPVLNPEDFLGISFRGVIKSEGNPQIGRGISFVLINNNGPHYTLRITKGIIDGFSTNKYTFALTIYDLSPGYPTDWITSDFAPEYDQSYEIKVLRQGGMLSLYVDNIYIGNRVDPVSNFQPRGVWNTSIGSVVIDDIKIWTTSPNQPPIANPNGPYLGASNTPIAFDGTGSTDPDGDALTYAWDFGDSTFDVGANPIKSYTNSGIYDVCLTVNDGTVDSDLVCTMAVIYDPDGGFITGGGWIWSEAGWCQLDEPCANAEGKANFGFVSKYKKGATVPIGNTEFNFTAGGLNFHSDVYEWLVINQAGSNAQYKGSGTINGEGEYRFMLWAGDKEPDTFRIKIWWEDVDGVEHVVYDNGFDQTIDGGNIVVHTK